MTDLGLWPRVAVGLVMVAMLALGSDPASAQPAPGDQPPPVAAPPTADPPITVVVTRRPRRGCEKTFVALIRETFQSRNRVPGHISTDFLVPATPSAPYTIIFKFDRESHYRQWLQSPARAVWLERLATYTEGAPQYQYHSGTESWVTLPDEQGYSHPEKYKTAAVTWFAIFPLVLGVANVVQPLTVGLSVAARTALVTGIVVPALTYVVMPPMTWLFHDWLYPPAPDCTG